MNRLYRISYEFPVESWGDSQVEIALQYWQMLGFQCSQTTALGIEAKRGNLLGNYFSFNMTKLICRLSVAASPQCIITSKLEVDGAGQIITEWNLASFKIEHLLFRRKLRNLPPSISLEQFMKANRRASLAWTISLGLRGAKLPQHWKNVIHALGDETTPPVAEIILRPSVENGATAI